VKSPEIHSTTKSIKPPLTRSPGATRTGSPTRLGSPTRNVVPTRKENMPPKNTLTERAVNRKSDESVLSPPSPDKRSKHPRHIPVPKSGGLSERTLPIHGVNSPPKRASTSPQKQQKLRVQSPQKVC